MTHPSTPPPPPRPGRGLATFTYGDLPVRTVTIDGEPWFVARDVCAVLGIANGRDAVSRLDGDGVGTADVIDSMGRMQTASVVNESGLYELIFQSRRPEARAFRRWVTHEVLPAIRRTGRYEVAQVSRRELAQMVIEEADRAERAEAKVLELEPKAAQADQHRAADGLTLVGDFANKLKAWAKREHNVRVLHEQVWDFLGDIGLIIRGNTVRRNHPTAFAVERDFVRLKETEYTHPTGARTSASPRLTPAGEGWAWDRAVKRIAGHGSLKPSTAVEKRSA